MKTGRKKAMKTNAARLEHAELGKLLLKMAQIAKEKVRIVTF